MAKAKTAEEKAAAKTAKEAEEARRDALTQEERDAEDAAAAAKAPPAPKKSDPIVVKYRDHTGTPVERTFSKDVHGDEFAKVAEEFKTTNADKIVA